MRKLTFLLSLLLILSFVRAEDFEVTAFSGQISNLVVSAEPGLTYVDFSIEIGGEPVKEFSVENISSTDYNILFRVPKQEGEYDLLIKAGEEELSGMLIINSITLTIETTYELEPMSNLAYKSESDYMLGFASENQPSFTVNQITIDVKTGPAYIFLTLPNTQLTKVNSFLSKQEFSNQINPLFGFPSLSSYFLSLYLEYPDIKVVSDEVLGFGSHNLLIEHILGESPKTVKVSSSNYGGSELITVEG